MLKVELLHAIPPIELLICYLLGPSFAMALNGLTDNLQ